MRAVQDDAAGSKVEGGAAKVEDEAAKVEGAAVERRLGIEPRTPKTGAV